GLDVPSAGGSTVNALAQNTKDRSERPGSARVWRRVRRHAGVSSTEASRRKRTFSTPSGGAKRRGGRTVFFGTPAIAVPALRALADTTDVVGVVCQPDRPAGRGLAVAEPAVKKAAAALGLEVHQPVKVKTGNLDEWLRARSPDLGVVLAYGRI